VTEAAGAVQERAICGEGNAAAAMTTINIETIRLECQKRSAVMKVGLPGSVS
jgi:hypothetical protein